VAYFEDLESWKAYPGKLNGFLLREAGQGEEETLVLCQAWFDG
jgi:hypothetical protein